ncbi:uncharacterized protein LOC114955585 [Acropora millepora]|uniref:uncharacterized protein LOC114955585 n=1 Tax=Acropora millepora TaxID=45264 RepID=UPI001CF421D6|nr:uncharacterized protein LOC114955585 [Acropora millepora]
MARRSNSKISDLSNSRKPPYVVLLGDVGTGKSTIVEKLTQRKDRSSNSKESFTKATEVFQLRDKSLIVADTPGSNALKEKFEHNVQIAAALNFRRVSRIFIVVKAETRIDTVVDNVRKYADRFLELPMDVVGVLVTHMDMVSWREENFTRLIDDELGIDMIVFSWITTDHQTLKRSILKTCTGTHNLTVDNENFFKLFNIHSNHRKILQSTSDEVKNFEDKKVAFDRDKKAFNGKDLVDLVFEFHAYMTDEIVEAQKRMSKKNNFTFYGDGAANEAGHVANMVNQLRMILYEIRVECLGYQSEHGVSELRKCPHCGIIWTKVEGCEGDTTCGNRPSSVNDFRDPSYAELGTFSFKWLEDGWQIAKIGKKNVKSKKRSGAHYGCGKSINWKKMATVEVPSEFSQTVKVGTSDIKTLPPSAENFKQELSGKIDAAGRKLKLDETPPHDPSDPRFAHLDIPSTPTASDSEHIGTNKSTRKTVEPGRYSEPQSGYAPVVASLTFSEFVRFGASNVVVRSPTQQNVREELPEMIASATRHLKLCKGSLRPRKKKP